METDILKTERRSFLRGSLMAGAALLLAAQIHPNRLSAKPLQSVPPGHEAMVSVGRAYLDQAPEEADVARLRHFLALMAEVSAMSLPDPEKERLAIRQLEDFRTGQTVLVQGWILSRTEATLCALIALHAEESKAAWHA